jgi:hypothetical protein
MNTMTDSFTPKLPFTCLTAEDLRRSAPSIYATGARPGVSSRYTFVSTADVVDLLRDDGWEPVKAREQHVRLSERKGFQMHEVRFARRTDLSLTSFDLGHTRPEIVLQNAHDGTKAYRIDAGLYRLVCRNGLTVADETFAHRSIRHLDLAPEKFREAAREIATKVPEILDVITRWRSRILTPAQQVEFARLAMKLRWGAESPMILSVEPGKLLTPLRSADAGQDVWTTFNVVQEHLIRGGDSYRPTQVNSFIRRKRTRPLAAIEGSQRFNKALWSLAEEFWRN